MKYVEIRRHSLRDGPGDISPAGRELAARAAGALAGPFHAYYSSPAPRAVQTAELMGGADVQKDERFGLTYIPKVAPYEALAQDIRMTTGMELLEAYLEVPEIMAVLRETAQEVLDAVIGIAAALPEGGRALVVSHGGVIEPLAMLAIGEFSMRGIGRAFAECEGARLVLDGAGTIVGVEILRLAEAGKL